MGQTVHGRTFCMVVRSGDGWVQEIADLSPSARVYLICSGRPNDVMFPSVTAACEGHGASHAHGALLR